MPPCYSNHTAPTTDRQIEAAERTEWSNSTCNYDHVLLVGQPPLVPPLRLCMVVPPSLPLISVRSPPPCRPPHRLNAGRVSGVLVRSRQLSMATSTHNLFTNDLLQPLSGGDSITASTDASSVTVEQHHKQLLAIAHQQHDKLQVKYQQLRRRYQQKTLNENELCMSLKQVMHRLYVEPHEPPALKSILHRPASSRTATNRTTYRPSSAASVTSNPAIASPPPPTTIQQLTSDQRVTVLHKLAVEPFFWQYMESLMDDDASNGVSSPRQKPPKAAASPASQATARTNNENIQSRVAQLLAESDEDLSDASGSDDAITESLQYHMNKELAEVTFALQEQKQFEPT